MTDAVVFLMGPTAGGKTSLAVELVKQLPLEIVSVDSAMVYRGMDIGTAKPPPAIQQIAPHRLIDICEPTEAYSAGRFREDALAAIEDIRNNNRVPLLVGGTGLYFRTLEQGFSKLPATAPALRARLTQRMRECGSPALHAELQQVDPESATRIHPNDTQRVQRALEVYEMTKTPLSVLIGEGRLGALPRTVIKLALAPSDRQVLRERAEQRFMQMLQQGLVDEVRGLFRREDIHEGPDLNAPGWIPAGLVLPGGPLQLFRNARTRRHRHPATGQAPAHLAENRGKYHLVRQYRRTGYR